MNAKRLLATTALDALVAAIAPLAARAETQSEWLQRQLTMTDGYAPALTIAQLKSSDGTARACNDDPSGANAITATLSTSNAGKFAPVEALFVLQIGTTDGSPS